MLHTSWSGCHLGSAWPETCSVLITRPYHCPGTKLKLTAGPATDLRGYEPNEPAHWWDGFRQAISESPWGALPQSHSSPYSAAVSAPSVLLPGICLWKEPSGFCCFDNIYLYFHISCVSHSVSFGFLNVLPNSLYTPDYRAEHHYTHHLHTYMLWGRRCHFFSVVIIWIIKDLKCLHHLWKVRHFIVSCSIHIQLLSELVNISLCHVELQPLKQ